MKWLIITHRKIDTTFMFNALFVANKLDKNHTFCGLRRQKKEEKP